jgi:hypothetical protein
LRTQTWIPGRFKIWAGSGDIIKTNSKDPYSFPNGEVLSGDVYFLLLSSAAAGIASFAHFSSFFEICGGEINSLDVKRLSNCIFD